MKKIFFYRNRRTNTKNRKSVKKRNFRINEKFHGFSWSGYSRIRWSRFESTGESDDKKRKKDIHKEKKIKVILIYHNRFLNSILFYFILFSFNLYTSQDFSMSLLFLSFHFYHFFHPSKNHSTTNISNSGQYGITDTNRTVRDIRCT